jgi:hypothetical protein
MWKQYWRQKSAMDLEQAHRSKDDSDLSERNECSHPQTKPSPPQHLKVNLLGSRAIIAHAVADAVDF